MTERRRKPVSPAERRNRFLILVGALVVSAAVTVGALYGLVILVRR